MQSSSSSSEFSSTFEPDKLTDYYDVIKESSYLGKRFTKQELEKMREEGLEIDLEKDEDEEFKAANAQEEGEKNEFYENMISSPYPQIEGKFATCITFKDRCRLMEPLSKGRIYKSIIRPGNGREVGEEDAVLFHMNAFVAEIYDEPFDSTFARKKPVLSKLNRVLKGYAAALLSMKVGEFAEFALHRSVAYGELGCPPRIPPGSDLIVIIELLDVFTKGTLQYYHSLSNYEQDDDELTPDQILEFAQEDRKTGSNFYRDNNFRKAVFHYRRAIDLLERNFTDSKVEDECNSILLTLYHNAANCQIQLEHGPSVINYAKRALRIDPESVKANYQLAKGYMKLGKYERAKVFLLKARRSRPTDPDINKELEVLNHKLTVENMDTKILYKQMAKSLVPKENEKEKAPTPEVVVAIEQEQPIVQGLPKEQEQSPEQEQPNAPEQEQPKEPEQATEQQEK